LDTENPLEEGKHKKSLLRGIIEKGKLAGVGLMTFIASCEGPEAPSTQVIDEYFTKNANAERIDKMKIQNWFNVIEDFNEVKEKEGVYTLDLRNNYKKSFEQDPEYKDFLSMYEADMTNDSTLFITEYNPVSEKLNKGLGIISNTRKYIFHKNGDVKMFMGNMFAQEGVSEDEGVLVTSHIDGKTGGIVYYKKDDHMRDNSFRLTKEGEMKVGDDYDLNTATESFDLLEEDITRIKNKLQE
jgi:hypothetical protein